MTEAFSVAFLVLCFGAAALPHPHGVHVSSAEYDNSMESVMELGDLMSVQNPSAGVAAVTTCRQSNKYLVHEPGSRAYAYSVNFGSHGDIRWDPRRSIPEKGVGDEQQGNSHASEEGIIVRINGLSDRYLHLNLDQYKGKEVGFKLRDITGDIVKKYVCYSETGSFSLDVGELPSGVYLLNVE